MSKVIRVLATAMVFFVVVCGAAWAAEYSMNIDHNTISFLTRDYKAAYGSSDTMFGFIKFRHIHEDNAPYLDPSTFTNGSISITPKQPVTINYVGSIARETSYENILTSTLGTETVSTSKTFQFKQLPGDYGVRPVNDKGWSPIFMSGAEEALRQAAYSINVDGKVSNKTFDKFLTTAEQIATKYVPYVELKLDATGKYAEGITWRPVDAKDPSKPAPNDPNDPRYEGLWGNYSEYSPSPSFYLRVKLFLKDGKEVWRARGSGGVAGALTNFSDLSGSETFDVPIALSEIACITVDDDSNWYWIFYPYKPNAAGGSPNITPGDVSYTPTAGVTGAVCVAANRPTPAGFDKAAMSDSSKIKRVDPINTIQLTVSYDRSSIPQGATVTFTIRNFSYAPTGKLYACAKNKNGVWDRFPITMTSGSISFTLPVLAYFSTSDIVITDIEESSNDGGGSGGGGCVTGAALFGAAALALIKRGTR